MLDRLVCLFSRHAINRHRVWHDGLEFRTKCARCRTPLLRTQDGWRGFDEEDDADDRRLPHPRAA